MQPNNWELLFCTYVKAIRQTLPPPPRQVNIPNVGQKRADSQVPPTSCLIHCSPEVWAWPQLSFQSRGHHTSAQRQRLMRSGLQLLTSRSDKDRHWDCAAQKDPSLETKLLNLHPSKAPGRIGDLEMLSLSDLTFLYLQKEKSNSYLSRVGEQLNEVVFIECKS